MHIQITIFLYCFIVINMIKNKPYFARLMHSALICPSEQKFQSVYMDIEEEQCKGVYLMIYKNVLLYSKENQVEIDFLEQMLSVLVPEMVIGRKDNVNIVSWLLTDYRMDTVDQIPELCDEEGNALKRDTRKKEGQEWGVLYKED